MRRKRPLPIVILIEGEGGLEARLEGHSAYPRGVRNMSKDAVGSALLLAARMCSCKECDACLVSAQFFSFLPK